jgi:hypothetical protein
MLVPAAKRILNPSRAESHAPQTQYGPRNGGTVVLAVPSSLENLVFNSCDDRISTPIKCAACGGPTSLLFLVGRLLSCEWRTLGTTGGSLRPLSVSAFRRGEINGRWMLPESSPKRRGWCRRGAPNHCRRPASPSGDVHQPPLQERQSKAIPVTSNCVTPSFRVSATTRIFLSCWEYRAAWLDSLKTP